MLQWLKDLDGFFKGMIAAAILLLLPLGFYVHFLNHVSINEVGVAYDSSSGEVSTQATPGWYLTNPLVLVTYVPTVPFQVTIPSSAKVINSKIVRFNISGLDEYIRLQGWEYQMEKDIKSSFLGYAFSGQQFPFLIIVQEPGAESYGTLRPGPVTSP